MQAPESTKHIRDYRRPIFEVALASWIRLAAAPVFAVLGCLSLLGPSVGIACISTPATFAFHDMGLMYLLMSLVHLPAWLTFVRHAPGCEAREPKDS